MFGRSKSLDLRPFTQRLKSQNAKEEVESAPTAGDALKGPLDLGQSSNVEVDFVPTEALSLEDKTDDLKQSNFHFHDLSVTGGPIRRVDS